MDRERALDINARLCEAYFLDLGLPDNDLWPDLSDVSLADAFEASRIVEADPVIEAGDGGKIITCHLAERAVPRILARVIAAHPAGARIVTETAE